MAFNIALGSDKSEKETKIVFDLLAKSLGIYQAVLDTTRKACREKCFARAHFHGSLLPLPTSRKHRKPQNSRTKIYFSNRHS